MAGLMTCDTLPPDSRHEVVRLHAEDRGESKGVLYTKGGEKTVICLMHPRGDMSRHYLTPYLLDGGYAGTGDHSIRLGSGSPAFRGFGQTSDKRRCRPFRVPALV
jgi:hypothetical protein